MPAEPAFIEHPQRREIVGEMHLRRLPILTVPAQALQLVRLVAAHERTEELASIGGLPNAFVLAGVRHCEGRWSSDVGASWERHSEASTVTVTVTNGFLLVSNAVGAKNNKLDAIDIVQISTTT